jgi:hypothetical protein
MDNLYTDMSTRLILVQMLKGFGTLYKLVIHKLKFKNGIIDHGSLHLRSVDLLRKNCLIANFMIDFRTMTDFSAAVTCRLPAKKKIS